MVVGDVNATVACSLVAAKLHIPVAHVEAGLRSGDRRMPEEINRIVTDQLSDLLFTTCRDADENLKREGIPAEKIHFTGNVMVDSLLANLGKTDPDETVRKVLGEAFVGKDFALLTLHRPSNVDRRETLEGWVEALGEIAKQIPLVCPLHPRTNDRLKQFSLEQSFRQAVIATEPLGYNEFIALMQQARLVITDSGGLQEETTVLGVPCLTIRENTERPVTVTHGTNRLVGTRPDDLVVAVKETLLAAQPAESAAPELWDGRAAPRIVGVLARKLTTGEPRG
jgi:UDP-N-acetylglucosamine 2-epimerase (non-hydrolysing)